MNTNTDGYMLIADGTNFNPTAVSGDISITNAGVTAIASAVIVNADIHASAGIVDSKLATITTADKVSAAAIQIDGTTTDGTGISLADTDKFLVDDGGTTKYINASQLNTYTSTSIAADDVEAGDAAVTISTSGGDITLDSPADVILDADGDQVSFKFGTATGQLDIGNTGSGDITFQQKTDAKDIAFLQYDGNEVIRIGDDRKLYFYDKGAEHISSDGTDFTVASGADVTVDAEDDIVLDANGGRYRL